MSNQNRIKVKSVILFTFILGIVLSISSCQTYENINKIGTMEEEIETLKQEREQLKQTYSEAQQFIEQARKAGGFDSPNEFINAMFETKKSIEKSKDTIKEFEEDVNEITNVSKEEINLNRKTSIDEISTMLKGFQSKFEEATDELDDIVGTANSRFSVSMSGLQKELDDYKEETDNRITVYMDGLDSKIDTIQSKQREWQDSEKEEILEEIEDLRKELTTLAIGRDSILDRMERRVDILAKSMETVSKKLQE